MTAEKDQLENHRIFFVIGQTPYSLPITVEATMWTPASRIVPELQRRRLCTEQPGFGFEDALRRAPGIALARVALAIARVALPPLSSPDERLASSSQFGVDTDEF